MATKILPVWPVFSVTLLAYTQLPVLFANFANTTSDCEVDQALV